MAGGFGPEGPGSIPDTSKDPPSACGARARKIHGSRGWSLAVYHRCCLWKKCPSFSETIQVCGGGR